MLKCSSVPKNVPPKAQDFKWYTQRKSQNKIQQPGGRASAIFRALKNAALFAETSGKQLADGVFAGFSQKAGPGPGKMPGRNLRLAGLNPLAFHPGKPAATLLIKSKQRLVANFGEFRAPAGAAACCSPPKAA